MEKNDQEFRQPSRTSRVPLAFAAALFFIGAVISAGWMSSMIFSPLSFAGNRSFTIQEGSSSAHSAELLEEKGIVRNAFVLQLILHTVYRDRTLKAGDYTVTSPLNTLDAATLLVQGMPRKEVTIRFTEGWTLADMAAYLDSLGLVSKKDFIAASLKNYRASFPFLPAQAGTIPLEGYLFPDTYRVFADSTANDIITKGLENFVKHYSPDMAKLARAQSRSIHEIVTMASILEREVQSTSDRRKVADILYRRLNAGMPLQADSTINYITGRSDPAARAADLAIDSAYNTYTHKGLPPGPIGNPGLDALQAALTPDSNPYWFFLTTPDGTIVYSKTFQEHVKNKIMYLSKKK